MFPQSDIGVAKAFLVCALLCTIDLHLNSKYLMSFPYFELQYSFRSNSTNLARKDFKKVVRFELATH